MDQGCATLLIKDAEAWEAEVLVRVGETFDEGGVKYDEYPVTERRPANWTLVERVPGEFVDDGLDDLLAPATGPITRVPAGHPCPQSGWWLTPARSDSRQHFNAGEIFPLLEGSDYGATFWLWDQSQG